jgi:Tat protein secretion system quality control protein TatD with DNase activity
MACLITFNVIPLCLCLSVDRVDAVIVLVLYCNIVARIFKQLQQTNCLFHCFNSAYQSNKTLIEHNTALGFCSTNSVFDSSIFD